MNKYTLAFFSVGRVSVIALFNDEYPPIDNVDIKFDPSVLERKTEFVSNPEPVKYRKVPRRIRKIIGLTPDQKVLQANRVRLSKHTGHF